MAETSQIENNHKNLVSQIENSWRVDREETIRLVEEAMTSIRGEENYDIKNEKIKKYEWLRKKVLKEYFGIQEVGINERSEFQREQNKDAKRTAITQTTRKTQEEIISTSELTPEEEKEFKKKQMAFFIEQLSTTNNTLVKPTTKTNGGKVEKSFEKFVEANFQSKKDIITYLKEKDPNTRTSLLKQEALDTTEKVVNVLKNLAEGDDEILKWYFQNLVLEKRHDPEIITSILLSFSKEKQESKNGRISKFIHNFFSWIEGIKGREDIILPIIERLEKEKGHSYNNWALAAEILWISNNHELTKKITFLLKDNKSGLWVFLTNMPIDLLNNIKDDETFLKQVWIDKKLLNAAYETRGNIFHTFQWILSSWLQSKKNAGRVEIAPYRVKNEKWEEGDEWDAQEQVDFVNSQIITQWGLSVHRKSFEILVKQDIRFIERVELLKSDKEIMAFLIENKRDNMPYILDKISPELLNNTEIIDKIVRSQEDKAYIDLIFSRISDKNSRDHLQKRMEELWINYNRDVFRDISFSKETITKEMEQQKINTDLSIQKELSTDKWVMVFNKNENWTYDIFVQWERIPWLTEKEYEWLENEKVKANLLHFYRALKDCGLEQIWTQRENIFKAISNQKGIAFDTTDGDYLSKNEVRIFLQTVIKSIAPQFKNQGEIEAILSAENEQDIIYFIRNYNGENNLLWPTKDKFGRTKLVEIFNDTFFPQEKQRVFQFAQFENAIRS